MAAAEILDGTETTFGKAIREHLSSQNGSPVTPEKVADIVHRDTEVPSFTEAINQHRVFQARTDQDGVKSEIQQIRTDLAQAEADAPVSNMGRRRETSDIANLRRSLAEAEGRGMIARMAVEDVARGLPESVKGAQTAKRASGLEVERLRELIEHRQRELPTTQSGRPKETSEIAALKIDLARAKGENVIRGWTVADRSRGLPEPLDGKVELGSDPFASMEGLLRGMERQGAAVDARISQAKSRIPRQPDMSTNGQRK